MVCAVFTVEAGWGIASVHRNIKRRPTLTERHDIHQGLLLNHLLLMLHYDLLILHRLQGRSIGRHLQYLEMTLFVDDLVGTVGLHEMIAITRSRLPRLCLQTGTHQRTDLLHAALELHDLRTQIHLPGRRLIPLLRQLHRSTHLLHLIVSKLRGQVLDELADHVQHVGVAIWVLLHLSHLLQKLLLLSRATSAYLAGLRHLRLLDMTSWSTHERLRIHSSGTMLVEHALTKQLQQVVQCETALLLRLQDCQVGVHGLLRERL